MLKGKSKYLLIALVVVLSLSSYYYYQYRQLHYVYKIKDLPLSEMNSLHFHPDSILNLAIASADANHSFSRSNRLQAWSTDKKVNAKVHSILNILSSLSVERSEPLKKALFTIKFKADDNTDWQLISDATHFYWQQGPLAAKGGLLPASYQSIFASGELMFENQNFTVCGHRPIEVSTFASKVKISNFRWVLDDKLLNNQNFMELWIGKNCKRSFTNILSKDLMTQAEYEQWLIRLKQNKTKFLQVLDAKRNLVSISWNEKNEITLVNAVLFNSLEVFDPEFSKELDAMFQFFVQP